MGKYPYFPKVNSTWNKEQTFDGITIKEVTTPSTNPPANYMKLYFKADGKLYKLNSSGAETVSNSTVSAITQALLDAKANINNPSFTGIVTIPNIANLETAVTANTAKVGITSGQASEITANTAKVGITSGQASEITANTAKVGITSGQASEITANTAKISLDDNSVTLAKLAHGTAGKYLGFSASGVPEEKTISTGVEVMTMPHDTTEVNHAYATTATGSTGVIANVTVTGESGGSGAGSAPYGSNSRQCNSTTNIVGNISGTITYTVGFNSACGTAMNRQTQLRNSSGGVVYAESKSDLGMGGSTSESITFTNLVDVATIWLYWRFDCVGGNWNQSNHSFTGTRETNVSPTELTNNTNATSYTTLDGIANYAVLDYGSSSNISSIAIKPTSAMTETVLLIQTSEDNSTWVTKRTILTSSLSNGVFNYILLPVTVARYIKILGNSGLSKAISFDEIKVKVNITESDLTVNHSHKSLSATDSGLTLSGD